MPDVIDKPDDLFDEFTGRIWSSYPQDAARALGQTLVNHLDHLSKEGGELIPREEYLSLLIRCVGVTHSFLGCSRFSARELLWGKPDLEKPRFLPGASHRKIRFFFQRVLPIILAAFGFFGSLGSVVGILHLFKVLDITQLLDNMTRRWTIGITIGTTVVVIIVLIGVLKWIRFEWANFDGRKVNSEIDEEQATQIYNGFEAYNMALKKCVTRGYPVARVFVLRSDQIKEDDKAVNKRTGKSWWQIMVEEHADFGIDIARICLTPDLEQKHSGRLVDQISVFSGQSGVGKSSIINTLCKHELKIGEIIKRYAENSEGMLSWSRCIPPIWWRVRRNL